MALPPEAWISSATDSERSRLRAASATSAPASTSAFAKASPSPVLPPVTTAVFPVRSKASRTANEAPLLSTRTAGSPIQTPHTLDLNSLSEQNYPRHGAEDTTDDRPHDGDPGVPPVVAALARYGQHGVGDPWAEVTGRVDGVAGRTTQREPDAEDEQTNEKRVQAGSYDRRRITSDRPGVRDNPRDTEDQHEGADDLGDDVCGGVIDRRCGAEHAEFEAGVLGLRPVRQVREPHDDGANEGTEELGDYVAYRHTPA